MSFTFWYSMFPHCVYTFPKTKFAASFEDNPLSNNFPNAIVSLKLGE